MWQGYVLSQLCCQSVNVCLLYSTTLTSPGFLYHLSWSFRHIVHGLCLQAVQRLTQPTTRQSAADSNCFGRKSTSRYVLAAARHKRHTLLARKLVSQALRCSETRTHTFTRTATRTPRKLSPGSSLISSSSLE